MSSATNQGTNSPKNEQADPLGSSNTKGDTSKGVPGNEQRGTESSHAKEGGNVVSDAAIAAADKSAKLIPGAEADRHATETGSKPQ